MVRAKDIYKKYRRAFTIAGRVLAVILALVLVIFCDMFKSINEDNFNFGIEFTKAIYDPLVWVLSVATTLAWTIIYVVAYITNKEKKIQANEDVFKTFDAMNKTKPNNFNEYINQVENVNRKRSAYLDMMENKLYEVREKIEKIDLEQQIETKPSIILKKEKLTKYGQLKAKEKDILTKSTSEYVNSHIMSLSVKYNRVKSEHFRLAISSTKTTDQTDSKERNRLAKKLVAKVISGVMIGMLSFTILSTLDGLFEWNDASLWITLFSILTSCFIQVYFGIDASDMLVDSEIIVPTLTKIEIIKASLQWDKADMKDKKFQELVDNYVEQAKPIEEEKKAVTISRAELDYLVSHREQINQEIQKGVS